MRAAADMEASEPGGRGRRNLKWASALLRARNGIGGSRMAVPKKIAQKARSQLKRKHHGQLPKHMDQVLEAQLHQLEVDKLSQQRHHLVKKLAQGAKKARAFLLRKLMRDDVRKAGSQAARREQRIRVLKAAPPTEIARRALLRAGLPCPAAGSETSTWEAMRACDEALCDQLELKLLATAQMQTVLEQLREQARQVTQLETKSAAGATSTVGGGGDAAACAAPKRDRARKKRKSPPPEDRQQPVLSSGTDGGDAEGGPVVLGNAFDASSRPRRKGERPKNIISSSGNRMGQRQRQKLAAEADTNVDVGCSQPRTARPQVARGGAKAWRHPGTGDGVASSSWPRGDASRDGCSRPRDRLQLDNGGLNSGSTTGGGAATLHPSWQAKRQAVGGTIQAFEGKRTTF